MNCVFEFCRLVTSVVKMRGWTTQQLTLMQASMMTLPGSDNKMQKTLTLTTSNGGHKDVVKVTFTIDEWHALVLPCTRINFLVVDCSIRQRDESFRCTAMYLLYLYHYALRGKDANPSKFGGFLSKK